MAEEIHRCCNCMERIVTLHIAREPRGNRAEACSEACVAALEHPRPLPWTLTLRQYERAIMEECLAGMPADDRVSKTEYLRLYPNDCRLSEWMSEIENAVDHREQIPAKVLDDVFRRNERSGWAFMKRMNAWGTVGDYLPPQTRAWQSQQRRDRIEAKKAGRARALAEV